MMKKLGFTLAEVLITLAVIGVVASMTIPSLMSNTQNQEYIAATRKVQSVMAQAATMQYALKGEDYSGTTSVSSILADRLNVVSKSASSIQLADGMILTSVGSNDECTSSAPCSYKVQLNGKNTTVATTTAPGSFVSIHVWNQTAAAGTNQSTAYTWLK